MKTKHTHDYKLGKSGSVYVCYCGSFRHANTDNAIVEIPTKALVDEMKAKLEYLRAELRAERISWGELVELQSLVPFIDKDDVELLEAAGVPEHD